MTNDKIADEAAQEAWSKYALYRKPAWGRTVGEDIAFDIARDAARAAFAKQDSDEYGRGVTAGKLEALNYTPAEREHYGKWIAQRKAQQQGEKQQECVCDETNIANCPVHGQGDLESETPAANTES